MQMDRGASPIYCKKDFAPSEIIMHINQFKAIFKFSLKCAELSLKTMTTLQNK